MPTVSKAIADQIIAGKYADDPEALKIVQYTTPEGDPNNYGVIYHLRDWDKYRASQWICNPQVYWESPAAAEEVCRLIEDESLDIEAERRMYDDILSDDEGDFF